MVRPVLPRILVVCGGVRTERDYIDALRRINADRIVVVVRPRGLDPAGCVRYAIAQNQLDDSAFDEVWCVVDVDEFDLTVALRHGRDGGVQLAVSNPCFELWLLLHLVDATRRFDGAKDVTCELRRVLPSYDKARLMFPDFRAGVEKAIERAQRLEVGGNEHPNPSSGMWRLTARIVGERI